MEHLQSRRRLLREAGYTPISKGVGWPQPGQAIHQAGPSHTSVGRMEFFEITEKMCVCVLYKDVFLFVCMYI